MKELSGKVAVVTLSETLFAELAASDAKIGVSVLCPGWVQTRLHESDRNKPGGADEPGDPDQEALRNITAGYVPDGARVAGGGAAGAGLGAGPIRGCGKST